MSGGGSARPGRSVSPGLPQQQPRSPSHPGRVSSPVRQADTTSTAAPAVADAKRPAGRPRTPSPARVPPDLFATPSPAVQRSPASAEDVLGPIDRAMQAIDQRLKAHEARREGGRTGTSPPPLPSSVDSVEQGTSCGFQRPQSLDLGVPAVAIASSVVLLDEPKKAKKALAWDPGPPVAIQGTALWGAPPQPSLPWKAEEEEERNALAALERRCSTRVSIVLTGGQSTPPRGSVSTGAVGLLSVLQPPASQQMHTAVDERKAVRSFDVVASQASAVHDCRPNEPRASEEKCVAQSWPSRLPFSDPRQSGGMCCEWTATPVAPPVEHPPFRPEVRQGASAFARALRQSDLAVKQALEAAKVDERKAVEANRKMLEEKSAVLALDSPIPEPRTPPRPAHHDGLAPIPSPCEAGSRVAFRAPQSDAAEVSADEAQAVPVARMDAFPEVQIASFALSMVYGKVKDV